MDFKQIFNWFLFPHIKTVVICCKKTLPTAFFIRITQQVKQQWENSEIIKQTSQSLSVKLLYSATAIIGATNAIFKI